MTPPLFLVADLPAEVESGAAVILAGPEGHHAADVIRLSVGEVVLLSNGTGRVADGVVESVSRGRVSVSVKSVDVVPPPEPRYVVVQALARGGRDEAAVEAMTEVGVDEVTGWQAARSVARWTDRTAAKWESVARAATKQSRRAWLPVVTGPASSTEVGNRLANAGLGIVLHGQGDVALADVEPPDSGEVVLVVGPEGGITDDELRRFRDAGAVTARLGTTVLRASTAGAVALAVLSAKQRWR